MLSTNPMTRAEFDREYAWRIADKVLKQAGYAVWGPSAVDIYQQDADLLVRQGLARREGEFCYRLFF